MPLNVYCLNRLLLSRCVISRVVVAAVVAAVVSMGLTTGLANAATIRVSASTIDSGACGPGTELIDRLPGQPGLDWGLTRTTSDVRAGLSLSTTCSLAQGIVTTMAARASFDNTLELGAYASSAIPAGVEPFTIVSAGAGFVDTITLVGGDAGTPGLLALSFVIDGATSGAYGDPGWNPWAGSASGMVQVGTSNLSLRGATAHTFQVPFVFGVAKELSISISAGVFGGDNPLPVNKLVFADFLHTATLMSATVLDADGTELPDGRIVSEAGLQYGQAAEPVPEPASLVLLGTGLVGLSRATRRR